MKIAFSLKSFVSRQASRASAVFRRRSSAAHLSSPMNNFPLELISYIFTLVVNGSDGNHNSNLVVLTHVCAQWRRIAFADGNLWTRIVLTFPVLPRHISYTVTSLLRSGVHPLDIFLDFRDPSWDWNEDTHAFGWQDMESVMRLFIVHMHRWKRFVLLSDTWSPIFTFLWYTRHAQSIPMLETLSLSRCNLYFAARGQIFQPISLRQPIQLFGGMNLERIRSVSLVGVHIKWNQTPLQNLTHLELKYMASDVTPSLDQFLAILNACQGLLRLAIFGMGATLGPPAITESVKIRLPSLRSLSFGFLDISYSIQFLSLLDIPLLEELTLEDISKVVAPMDNLDSSELVEWLTLLSGLPLENVRVLELQGTCCNPTVATSYLSKLVSLQKLSLLDISGDIVRTLVPTPICASLQELHCQDVDVDALLTMAYSRTTLQKISLEFIRLPCPPLGSPDWVRITLAGIEVRHMIGSDSESSTSESSPS